jgi:hypothetical protein
MSDMLRIGLVAEGVTDYEVLRASIESMLGAKKFDLKLLQPEESVAFTGAGDAGVFGGGWRGVYKWALQAVDRSGQISADPLFLNYDLLVVHLDADVAGEDPANYPKHAIPELKGMLPCEKPCPPPSNTTDLLRKVILSWLGENTEPLQVVLCTPSKSTESWVMALFFPNDKQMKRLGWECHPDPAARLSQQPIKHRFRKSHEEYRERNTQFRAGWPTLVNELSEAKRFNDNFELAVSKLADSK